MTLHAEWPISIAKITRGWKINSSPELFLKPVSSIWMAGFSFIILYGLIDMKLPTVLLLLICFCKVDVVSAQDHNFTATVLQPAGSVILPSAQPDLQETIQTRKQPLYNADDVLLYLPAPANIAKSITSSGKQIEVIIMGPRLSNGQVYDILPIGLMEFGESDGMNQRILAIPANASFQTIKSPSLKQLQFNYPGVIEILSIWFVNAYSDRRSEYLGVKDEKEAINLFLQ